MNKYLLTIICLAAAILLAIIARNLYKRIREYRKYSRQVHQEKSRMAFLINKDFMVKETNIYDKSRRKKDGQPRILGNVLHCKTACDSGTCGTGLSCSTCPVRYVIKNSFLQRRDFTNIEATMTLYDDNHEEQNVDVKMDGKLVLVNLKPYMVVTMDSTPHTTVNHN